MTNTLSVSHEDLLGLYVKLSKLKVEKKTGNANGTYDIEVVL